MNALTTPCPFCCHRQGSKWAEESSFTVIRCNSCRLLFLDPMPAPDKVNEAVRTGIQKFNSLNVNVRSRRSIKKIAIYRKVFETMFKQIWSSGKPIIWIDIGSGYGETLQAVKLLAPQNSIIKGVEPMKHKAEAAAGLGLDVINDYLQPGQFQADVVSLIDIYSHVPDFWTLLDSIKSNLKPQGEFFLESGNLADLDVRQEFFGELGLPDHLVFAGESHFVKYLESSGFEVLEIRRERADDLVDFVKSVGKKIIGRPVNISVPYTSRYRQLKIRAKLKAV